MYLNYNWYQGNRVYSYKNLNFYRNIHDYLDINYNLLSFYMVYNLLYTKMYNNINNDIYLNINNYLYLTTSLLYKNYYHIYGALSSFMNISMQGDLYGLLKQKFIIDSFREKNYLTEISRNMFFYKFLWLNDYQFGLFFNNSYIGGMRTKYVYNHKFYDYFVFGISHNMFWKDIFTKLSVKALNQHIFIGHYNNLNYFLDYSLNCERKEKLNSDKIKSIFFIKNIDFILSEFNFSFLIQNHLNNRTLDNFDVMYNGLWGGNISYMNTVSSNDGLFLDASARYHDYVDYWPNSMNDKWQFIVHDKIKNDANEKIRSNIRHWSDFYKNFIVDSNYFDLFLLESNMANILFFGQPMLIPGLNRADTLSNISDININIKAAPFYNNKVKNFWMPLHQNLFDVYLRPIRFNYNIHFNYKQNSDKVETNVNTNLWEVLNMNIYYSINYWKNKIEVQNYYKSKYTHFLFSVVDYSNIIVILILY